MPVPCFCPFLCTSAQNKLHIPIRALNILPIRVRGNVPLITLNEFRLIFEFHGIANCVVAFYPKMMMFDSTRMSLPSLQRLFPCLATTTFFQHLGSLVSLDTSSQPSTPPPPPPLCPLIKTKSTHAINLYSIHSIRSVIVHSCVLHDYKSRWCLCRLIVVFRFSFVPFSFRSVRGQEIEKKL